MWTFRRRYLYLVTGLLIGLLTLYFAWDHQQVPTTQHTGKHNVKGHQSVKGYHQPIKDIVPLLREEEHYKAVDEEIRNIANDKILQNRKEDVEPVKADGSSVETIAEGGAVPNSNRNDGVLIKKDLAQTSNRSKVSESSAKITKAKSITYLRKSNNSVTFREKQRGWDTKPNNQKLLKDDQTKVGQLNLEQGSGLFDGDYQQRVQDRSQGSPAFWRRLDEYCNHPQTPVHGEEGHLASGDYHLRSVHTIMRHGDRTPMTDLKSVVLINWKPNWHCDLEEASRKPLFSSLAQLISSTMKSDSEEIPGRRVATYLQRLPVGVLSQVCARSQMTPQGWMQQILLGQHMRAAYTGALLTKKSSWRDTVVPVTIHSTGNARTQQSAFAFMFGLLPDLRYQDGARVAINAHVNFCHGIICSCPAVTDLGSMKDVMRSRHQKENKNITALLQEIEEILQPQVIKKKSKKHTLPGIGIVQENLFAALCHNMSLPCGPTKCLTSHHMERLVAYIDHAAQELHTSDDSPLVQYSRLFMHPLLYEIALDMETMTNKTRKRPHFTLYSGHDITLTPLIDALGLPDHRWPSYAAHIVLELWTDNFSQNYVRILYNGRDQMKHVRFCRGRVNKDGLCPLQYFLSFVKHDNMQYFKTESYAEACQLNFKD